ncbi:MAG: hypothetical protein WC734_03240 [Patescibacteria group bacterium]
MSKFAELVAAFFVEKTEGNEAYWAINDGLTLALESVQERCAFLADVIRYWHDRRRFFCHDNTTTWEGEGENRARVDLPESSWTFSYKTPSDCGGCVNGQRFITKIFGNCRVFNALSFVTFHGDREYSFRFDLLVLFAEQGEAAVKAKVAEEKAEAARCQAEVEAEANRKQLEAQKAKLAERFAGVEISDELYAQILKHAVDSTLTISSPNVAAVVTSRSEWGSSGGIGYWSGVRVYYGAQSDHQEWQWRDRYSADNDRPYLSINSLGAITVIETGGKIEITVELKNRTGSRTTTFIFEKKEALPVSTLSTKKQAAFLAVVQSEQQRIMAELERMWGFKPQMIASTPGSTSGYRSYQRPNMKQSEVRAELGVAAFITEEQIDHHPGGDPQIRFEMYVLTVGDTKAVCKAEDHGYGRDGGAFLAILEVTADQVVINTKSGKQTISLTKKQ